MQRFMSLLVCTLILVVLTACGSPPTKSVRTTTTTTTVDDDGNASAVSHSELRSNVPVDRQQHLDNAASERRAINPQIDSGSVDARQTVDESRSTDVDGTTTVRKRVTNY
jgi:hypothetical protein